MVMLHLVRHARSAQDPGLPSWEWPLAEGAEVDAQRLRVAGVLPNQAVWVSSTETKAVATASLLTAAEVRQDGDLREAVRDPAWLRLEEFHALVLQCFAAPGESVRAGWEPLAVTEARVVAAARDSIARADGHDVVLVGHGTAWTMLVSGLTGEPPDVAGWDSMQMPDHCALEWPSRIVAPWGSWNP